MELSRGYHSGVLCCVVAAAPLIRLQDTGEIVLHPMLRNTALHSNANAILVWFISYPCVLSLYFFFFTCGVIVFALILFLSSVTCYAGTFFVAYSDLLSIVNFIISYSC